MSTREEHPETAHLTPHDESLRDESESVDSPAPMSRLMRNAALWSGLNAFLLRVAQFAVGVVAARIIEPKQFGVFAVALTVQAVIVNVSELGVSAALVRARGDVSRVAPTVAFISIISSAVLNAAMFLSAPWLATLLGAPAAANVIRILSFTVLLGGISAVPYALLVRGFRQDKRFVADGSNFAVSSVALVVLGLSGFGAAALGVSKLLGQIASVLLLFAIVRPRYRPRWHRKEGGEVLKYSLPLAGADVVNFSLANVDYIVVGRLLGAQQLGFYNLAYNISGWPVSVLGLMINEVALPAFAHARDNVQGLARRMQGALALTASAAFPLSALIFVLSHPIVLAVYGTRWASAAPALAMLGLFGSLRILVTLLTNVLAALGRSRHVLAVQLVWITTLVPALIVGVSRNGILGAAVAQEVVGIGIVVPLALLLVARAGCGSVWRLLGTFVLPAVGAVACGLTAYGVTHLIATQLLQVLVGGLAGAAVYVLLLGRWLRRLLREARHEWDDQSGAGGMTVRAPLEPIDGTP